jgi:hypothetical protein
MSVISGSDSVTAIASGNLIVGVVSNSFGPAEPMVRVLAEAGQVLLALVSVAYVVYKMLVLRKVLAKTDAQDTKASRIVVRRRPAGRRNRVRHSHPEKG